MIFSTKPNRQETVLGCVYLAVDFLVLPYLLSILNRFLPSSFSSAELNFIYYFLNFAFVLPIFRRYLLQSVKDALRLPLPTLWCALLGYMGNLALSELLLIVLIVLFPSFANINDLNIYLMLQENFPMVATGTILLVPIAEETLFRGLIFRGLYDRSPVLAYLISMISFAAVHVVGYIGQADPKLILISFLQYLPAGYCLCFAYRRGGSIISPILMHMAVNAVAVYSMR